MRKVWLFRILIVLSPFLFCMFVLALLEGGFRIYAAINGPFYIHPPSLRPLPEPSRTAPQSEYSLPTHLRDKPYHKGLWLYPANDRIDKTHAHLKWPPGVSVFSLPSNKSEYLSARMMKSGEVLYNVLVETDEYGQRITPLGKQRAPKNHLIFWGCSFVMGEGVNQNETLPFYTANATDTYRAYNMGIYGGTISDAWVYTNELNNLDSIKEPKGVGLYIFLDDHIVRYKGNTQYLGQWLAGRPLVRPDSEGRVRLLGPWGKARPFFVALSRLIESSVFLTAIHFSIPSVQEKDVEDFIKVVASVRDAYWKKFGADNPFIVVLYFQNAMFYAPHVKALLEKAKIQYLDYTSLYLENLSESQLRIHGNDGHPNALAHKIVGELIAEDLKLQ